jgi:hypothetical protein
VQAELFEADAHAQADRLGRDPLPAHRWIADEVAEVAAAVVGVDRPDLQVANVTGALVEEDAE